MKFSIQVSFDAPNAEEAALIRKWLMGSASSKHLPAHFGPLIAASPDLTIVYTDGGWVVSQFRNSSPNSNHILRRSRPRGLPLSGARRCRERQPHRSTKLRRPIALQG